MTDSGLAIDIQDAEFGIRACGRRRYQLILLECQPEHVLMAPCAYLDCHVA